MFREPSSVEVTKSKTLKDSSAGARSAIRRQPTIRRSSRQRNSSDHSALRAYHLPPSPFVPVNELAHEFDEVRRPSPHSSFDDRPLDATSAIAELSRRADGRRILRDAIRHRHIGRRLRITRDPTLRFDDSSPVLPVPEFLNRSSPGLDPASGRHIPEHAASFTSRFAPASAYHSAVPSQAHPDGLRFSPLHRYDGPLDDPVGSTVPLLRRTGHRSVSDARRPPNRGSGIVDGLGDRQRSLSPDNEHENDAWETLLTTITPDANLPSAESSFTSASASASASATSSRFGSSRTSAASSQTTQPSSYDFSTVSAQRAFDPFLGNNPCDYPSADSETESELTHDTAARHYRHGSRRTGRTGAGRLALGPESTMGSQPPIPSVSISFSNPDTDPDTDHGSEADHTMQDIFRRLAHRNDVPDSWLTAAGVPRPSRGRFSPAAEPSSDTSDRGHLPGV